MARTYVILDGLQDPALGQALSSRWAQAGLANGVDVSGQCAWLWQGHEEDGSPDNVVDHAGQSEGQCVEKCVEKCVGKSASLTEADVARAAAIARTFGLEVRDRVGQTFVADNDLAALRARMAYEYKSRLATALVFGLPALALHYVGPVLAGGGGQDARAMLYPWLFELLLVGWACVAAGWPILWQGALSARRLRATGDLLTTLIVAVAFIPSAVGVLSMAVVNEPWFGAPAGGGGPTFGVAMVAIVLSVLQRWLAHRSARQLSGKAHLMLTGYSRLVMGWLVLSVVVGVMGGWHWGLTMGLLMPPMISLGAVNPWSGSWSMVLPVFAFAGFILIGPGALGQSLEGVGIETVAGFGLIMTCVFALGWGRYSPRSV